jgi:type II secretory pathway predicted ATPase ExeA
MILKYQRTGNEYLSHFGLQEKAFEISADPKFQWLGEKHKEALETLLHAVLYKDGYVVVTGDVGTGKTMLASALMNNLGDQVNAAKVPFPEVEILDFFKLIAMAYGISENFQSQASFLVHFESFLRSSFSAGKKVVLIIDEAQRLTSDNLRELFYLSNIEENGARLLKLVFVGQNEFSDILLKGSSRALSERVTINYNLGPLTQDETRQYILHRLKVAQCDREIFTSKAIEDIFLFSNGIPRLINIVCDLALLITYFESGTIVRPETIKKCLEKLRVPGERAESGGNGSNLASETEGKDESGIVEEIHAEVRDGNVKEEVRSRARVRAAYATGFGLLIVLLGFIFFFHPGGQVPQDSTHEELKEVSGKNTTNAKEVGSLTKYSIPDAASLAIEKPASSESARKSSESIVPPKEAGVPKETKTFKGASVQGLKTERQAPAGSRASARPAKQTFPTPLRDEMGPYEKETRIDDKGKAASEERGGRMGQTPGSTTGQSGQETTTKDGEEIDPGRVMEWLLERRSEKK